MKTLFFVVFILLLLDITCQLCRNQITSHYGFYLNYPSYKQLTNENPASCFLKCLSDKSCYSINFNFLSNECELIGITKKGVPGQFAERYGWTYAETKEPDYGSSKSLAVASCKRILELHPRASSGIYWISPGIDHTQTSPFKVYCDMQTDGGGWTLVYSYRFLHFSSFSTPANAISPLPNWPGDPKYMNTAISTTVPLSETSYSAMAFSLWKEIGHQFLIKPTISNWISCVPGKGDFVNWKSGSIKCNIVKSIANVCQNVVPNRFSIYGCGPIFLATKHYIFLTGSTSLCTPIHDPCGTESTNNHVTNVQKPGGAIYIR